MDCAPRAACLFGEAYSFTTVDCALPVDCVDVGAWSIEVVIFEAIASLLAERVGTAADTIPIASASSKTAIGLAHLLSTHKVHPCHIVGLTSERTLILLAALACMIALLHTMIAKFLTQVQSLLLIFLVIQH